MGLWLLIVAIAAFLVFVVVVTYFLWGGRFGVAVGLLVADC